MKTKVNYNDCRDSTIVSLNPLSFKTSLPTPYCDKTWSMNRYTLIPILMMTVLLGSSGVCWGADHQKGLDAYEKGNYATALKEWTPLAKQGNAVAQYNLDVIYDNGLGVHRIIGLR